jgi:hypothetical protein
MANIERCPCSGPSWFCICSIDLWFKKYHILEKEMLLQIRFFKPHFHLGLMKFHSVKEKFDICETKLALRAACNVIIQRATPLRRMFAWHNPCYYIYTRIIFLRIAVMIIRSCWFCFTQVWYFLSLSFFHIFAARFCMIYLCFWYFVFDEFRFKPSKP